MAERAARWTTAALEQALADLEVPRRAAPVDPVERDWPLVAAAAVLSSFSPASLRTLEGERPDSAALARLLDGCKVLANPEQRWRLRRKLRRRALARLGTQEAMARALAANPDRPRDDLQRIFEAYLDGPPPLPDGDSVALACTREVATWLHGILDGVPDPEDVRRAVEYAYLLEPFRRLAGEGFRGRGRDLARLRRYVGMREAASPLESTGRLLRWGLNFHERRPLLVWGIGGIGKSTLLSRFLLEHAQAGPDERISFAYVDFDRADVTPDEPLSILLEAARQLAPQHPQQHDELLEFRRHWSRELARIQDDYSIEPLSSASASVEVRDRFAVSHCIREFSALAAEAVGEHRPLVLVLDTFEEVQYRNRFFAGAIWDMLGELQGAVPALRTIVAGRARLDDLPCEEHELKPLDDEAAAELLRANGVDDPATVRQVVRRLGGNPLTLRLAAQVVRQDEGATDAIDEIRNRSRRAKVWRAREEVVQALLYGRLLRRLHSADIRKLAHPGLALRRITPEAIREVLAGPCELGDVDEQRAAELFEELRREVALVTPAADGALEHRPDVRRAMLPLVRADQRERVEAIHEAAVAHYARREGTVNRAEELYHRLALDQTPSVLDERWTQGVEERLWTAVEELPPRAQTYLASRVGADIAPDAWKKASLEDQERGLEHEVRSLLRLAQPEEALAMLRDQRKRSDFSPLFALEAIAAREVGDYTGAAQAIERGLDAASGVEFSRNELELLQLSARMHLDLDEPGKAREALELARRAADWLGDDAQHERIEVQLAAIAPAQPAG
jgi:AAA ATPase-like protein